MFRSPTNWQAGTDLCVLLLIGYRLAFPFWTAAFPQLARIASGAQGLRDETMWEEEYSKVDSLQRNTLANVAFYACSCVEVFQPEIRR